MRSYHGKRLPNQGEAQMGVPTLGINMYNSDSEVGENYLSSAINAYAHKNECVVLDPGAVYDPSIDMLFPALDITGEALTADIVLNGSTTYLVMLRRNTDGTLSILSLDVHNKTVVHNVSVASTWSAPSADFVCYSTIARTPAEIKVVFSSPEYNDIIFYDFTATPEIYTLVFKPKRMTTHLNRLFAIDTSMALWWSGAGQYTNWYGDTFPDNYILEDAGVWPIATESLLSDIAVFNNNLYVFAPNNIYIFRGTDYSSFSLELILTNFGVSPNHDYNRVYSTKGYLYFIYRDAIYEFNGDSYPTIISRPVAVAGQIANGIGGGIPRLTQGTFFDGNLWADNSRLFFHLGREYYQFDIQERTWWRSAGFALGNEFSGTNDVRQLFFYNFTTNRTDCVVSSIDGANSKLAAFKRLYMDINTAHLETKAFNSMPSHDHTLTNIIIEYKTHIDNEEEYIQIWTADDFYGVRDNLDGNYIIMDDIDIEDWSGWKDFPDFPDWDFEYNWPDPSLWPKIGTPENPFTGTFISNGFTINGWELEYHPGTIINGTMTVWVDDQGERLPNPFFYSYWTYPQQGDGSIDNPYEIWTASDLNHIRDDLVSSYIQMADIDLLAWGEWTPIQDFEGRYNGNGYSITGMYINTGNQYLGLFGYVGSWLGDGQILLENITLEGTIETPEDRLLYVGLLLGSGYIDDDGYFGTFTIRNCSVSGSIIAPAGNEIGGLMGDYYCCNSTTTIIENIVCNVDITCPRGSDDRDAVYVGGVIGYSYVDDISSFTVRDIKQSGDVKAVLGGDYIGGIIGSIEVASSGVLDISYCKSTASLSGHYAVGGLVGYCDVGDQAMSNISKSSFEGIITAQNWVRWDSTNFMPFAIGSCFGFLGNDSDSALNISNIFARTTITAKITDTNPFSSVNDMEVDDTISGFIGTYYNSNNGEIRNCYADVDLINATPYVSPKIRFKAFVGYDGENTLNVYNSYYNSDKHSFSDDKAYPRTEMQLQDQSTFIGWDFDFVWMIEDNFYFGKPFLRSRSSVLIEVWTADDLHNVRNNLDQSYIQMADIDMSEYESWTPIEEFAGTYDGNNFRITNLKDGLFGWTESNLVVKNVFLTLRNTRDLPRRTFGILDGVLGNNTYVLISNCHVSGTLYHTTNFMVGAGGIIGTTACNNSYIRVDNCTTNIVTDFPEIVYNTYKIYVGGIVGQVTGSSSLVVNSCTSNLISTEIKTVTESGAMTYEGIGGIIGAIYGHTNAYIMVYNSSASGHIVGHDELGGIVGSCSLFEDSELIIDRCRSDMKIDGHDHSYSYSTNVYYSYSNYIGGIVGFVGIFSSTAESDIARCYFDGTIETHNIQVSGVTNYLTNRGLVGGLVGSYESTVSKRGNISDSYSNGTITYGSAVGAEARYKAVANYLFINYISLSSCFYNSDKMSYSDDKAVALTDAQMKQESSFTGFSFDRYWAIDPAKNGGYPYLQWEGL